MMKYFLVICTFISCIFNLSNPAYGYTINLTPQNIETYVYEMPQQLGFEEVLSARGNDYIELRSYSKEYNQLVNFGSSVDSRTQKSYGNDKVITDAFIDFKTWAHSEPNSFFETNHYFYCDYNLNILSEFPDHNHNNRVSLTSHIIPVHHHFGELKLYDDSSNLIYYNDDFIGFKDIKLTLGKDYYLDIKYYINHLLDNDIDIHDTLGFTLVENKPVPEPSSWLLLGIGLLGLAGVARKKIFSRPLKKRLSAVHHKGPSETI